VVSDFHLLLEEEIPALMRYAKALTRDVDDAEDLVADTVREALAQHRKGRRAATNLHVRLLTILHDLRDNPFRQAVSAIAPVASSAKAELTLSQLDQALGELPEEQRAPILLIGLERLTYAQAAEVLRLPLGTARARLARGRANLCRAMGVAESPEAGRAAA
jgi:DNA-directed RNA polymerase specialized sigma24 family protein